MNIESIIKAALFTPTSRGWGLPTLFWGLSGVGKSDVIEAVGRKWRMHVEVLSPSERGEGAFGVTPVPREVVGGFVMSYPAPDWIEAFEDFSDRGIVFLDELTTAPPIIQAAMLGLIQAKRIGGATLPKGVRILAAANPPELAAGGWDLAPPAANRLAHLAWEPPTVEEWSDFELGGASLEPEETHDPEAEERRVMSLWGRERAKAVGLVTAFHTRKRGMLHSQPEAGSPAATRAWPSHRSWSNAILAWASSHVHELSPADRIGFVEGFVGAGPTRELLAFANSMDLPDPVDLLEGRVSWDHDSRRLDRSQAVMSSLVSLVTSDPKTNATVRIPALWSILDRCPADDIAAMAVRPLSKAGLTRTREAIPVLARLRPVLAAAGAL